MIYNNWILLFKFGIINISIKLILITLMYYIFIFIKYNYFLFPVENFILFFMHGVSFLILAIRFIYFYYTRYHIKNTFNTIKNNTIKLFQNILISYNNHDFNDIDDSLCTNINKYKDIIKYKEILEFKNLLIFYISYYFSILSKISNNTLFLLDIKEYDEFIVKILLTDNYNFNINNNLFKLDLLEYYIKSNLNKLYDHDVLTFLYYKKCLDLIFILDKDIKYIYLNLEHLIKKNNKVSTSNSQQSVWINNMFYISLINIFNILYIYITIILTIIYYINLYSYYGIIYVILISFIYLYIQFIINNLLNKNIISNNSVDYDNTIGIDLELLLLNIHNEINLLYKIFSNNISIIY